MIRPWAKITLIFAVLLLTGCVIRIERPVERTESESRAVTGPLPIMDTGALDDYDRHKLFASRYIEEGDYPKALGELSEARKLRQDAPGLYELMGIAHDADRESAAAYENFLRAGRIYLEAGDLDSATRMLGWLGTFATGRADPRAVEIEKGIRLRRKALDESK